MILLQSPLSSYTGETFIPVYMREISSGTRKIKTEKKNRNFRNIRGYSLIIYSIIIQ